MNINIINIYKRDFIMVFFAEAKNSPQALKTNGKMASFYTSPFMVNPSLLPHKTLLSESTLVVFIIYSTSCETNPQRSFAVNVVFNTIHSTYISQFIESSN